MIKKIFKKVGRILRALFKGLVWYSRDLALYRRMLSKNGKLSSFYVFPKILDKDSSSHTFDKHYVYMDRWALQKLLITKPLTHVDVGSSIRFLSMASTVTKVTFIDIRPVKIDFENFECKEGSILEMPYADNTLNSLSCLHVAEHIGLGRYGDPLDTEGTVKACKELTRVLEPGGTLYFATPIGKTATYFNAHRVHAPHVILEYFKGLQLKSFAAVDDQGHYHPNANPNDYEHFTYACGMFELIKPI